MRQAPDCILIGEIRDKETMQAAIAYAQTGHLCLATLHANNSYHALNRIINFFPLENRTRSVPISRSACGHHFAAPGQARTASAADLRSHAQHPPHQQELIERGEVQASRMPWSRRWPRARRPSSRIFSASIREGVITLDEALANADSPTNLTRATAGTRKERNGARRPLDFDSTSDGRRPVQGIHASAWT
jgi:twitching motility protein PilU